MNLIEQKIEKKATQFATNLRTQAAKNEPRITTDLQKIASEVAAEMVGLEHKFKTEESLTRKIVRKTLNHLIIFTDAGFSFDESFEKAFKLQSKHLNDVLRYTIVLPLESYVFGFKQTLENLKRRRYVIPENKIWNAWKNVGTKYDKGYRGINITVFSSQGQIFELQFHTKESFQLKTETHELYKEVGLEITSDERRSEITQIMVESAKNVLIPKGVRKL